MYISFNLSKRCNSFIYLSHQQCSFGCFLTQSFTVLYNTRLVSLLYICHRFWVFPLKTAVFLCLSPYTVDYSSIYYSTCLTSIYLSPLLSLSFKNFYLFHPYISWHKMNFSWYMRVSLYNAHTGWPRSYRKYILQITHPSQYRYAVTSGSPSKSRPCRSPALIPGKISESRIKMIYIIISKKCIITNFHIDSFFNLKNSYNNHNNMFVCTKR